MTTSALVLAILHSMDTILFPATAEMCGNDCLEPRGRGTGAPIGSVAQVRNAVSQLPRLTVSDSTTPILVRRVVNGLVRS